TVDIISNKKKNIIGVPISAIVIKSDTTDAKKPSVKETTVSDEKFEAVYVKEGDVAKLRVVKTGIQDDSNIEIISGLKEGETVITGPYNTVTKLLKDGDKVEVASTEKEKKEK